MESLNRREFGFATAAVAASAATEPQTYGRRLRAAREAAGLNVYECGERIGAEPADWQAWELDEVVPTAPAGLLAAELLNVEPRWLAFGSAV
jgi:transcriptional regulator with XRE-family HTH domain